jgi:hypothetical protein
VLTAGLGEMGGAQPLAITMNEGVAWWSRSMNGAPAAGWKHRYIDEVSEDMEDALRRVAIILKRATALHRPDRQRGRPSSPNCWPAACARRGHRPDLGPRLLAYSQIT